MRYFLNLGLAVLVSAAPAFAQTAPPNELSGSVGYGHTEGDGGDSSAWGGVSFARLLGPGFAKLNYEYFRRSLVFENERFHLLGVAWRVQGGPSAYRPFLEIGWVFGVEDSSLDGTKMVHGPGVAGGLTFLLPNHLFIRPEARFKLLGPGPIGTIQPAVAMGWQF